MPALNFVRGGKANAADYIAERIAHHLAGGDKVLWLLSGGSAIAVAVRAADSLAKIPNLANLTIGLADERYGAVNHADSNWRQLMESGFKLEGAELVPVLNGQSLAQTAKGYEDFLLSEANACDYSLALAGIGSDGHTFGIKPGSPAVNSQKFVEAYEWDDYVRLTPTAEFLKLLDLVVFYASGAEKRTALDRLEQDGSPDAQPAQLLKNLKETIIFNDYKGGAQ